MGRNKSPHKITDYQSAASANVGAVAEVTVPVT